LQRAYANQNIKGIILNIDSGGGEGGAMRLMSNTIAQRNKPILGFVDDFAASAAAGIASGTDWIVDNNNVAKFGSFGTYMTIGDYTEAWKMQGVKLIEVYADQSKDKNKEYYDALKGDLSGIKDMANRYNDEFLSMVDANRNGKLKNDSWNTGKLFDADKAMEIGLIDEIATWEETVYSFANSLNL
jgi:ClpP class serine protease